MQDLTNIIQNSGLASIAKGASSGVLNAIGQASSKTGVDFAYLVQQAQAESNFDTDVKASSSSATGLFQFINATWLDMVDKHGYKHGIDTQGKSKQEILELRKDPVIASNMAAEFASDNEAFLDAHWGGDIGSTELYLAHFMGAGGASSFLNARDENGLKTAANLFPAAAKANSNVFYDSKTGRAKSVDEVYAFFDKKFQIEGIDPKTIMIDEMTQLAQNASQESATPSRKEDEAHFNSLVFNGNTPNYYSQLPNFQLVQSPVELMILSQLDLPGFDALSDERKNSLF